MNEFDDTTIDRTSYAYRDLIGRRVEPRPRTIPRTVVASTSSNPLDDELRANCSSGPITITVETAVGADGRRHTYKKIDSTTNAMTVSFAVGQTGDGLSTIAVSQQYQALKILANGVTWDLETPTIGVYSSLVVSGLTAPRVPYISTGGLFADSANLTFNGSTLSTVSLGASANVSSATISTGLFRSGTNVSSATISTGTINAGGLIASATNVSSATISTSVITATSTSVSGLTAGRVVYVSTSGLLVNSANLTFDGTTLSTLQLTVTSTATLGALATDIINFNAGVWTLGNDYTATRAAGTVATGNVSAVQENYTITPNSSGATSYMARNMAVSTSGANSSQLVRCLDMSVMHSGSAQVVNLSPVRSGVMFSGSGSASNVRAYDILPPTFTSTGVASTFRQYASRNCGNATSVSTGIVFEAIDQTGCAISTIGFRGQLVSGTGKWNALMDGTANNAFVGNVRIGSTAVPAVPLDVTGDINGSTNFTAWTTSWTLTRTGWTDVGSPTVTQRYCQVRNLCYFQAKVVPGTTIATIGGTSYFNLPLAAAAASIGGDGSMMNITTLIGVGNIVIDAANSRCYVPSQGATANTLTISGWYEV